MKKKYDLTEGNILYKLTLLSLPIMGMSLIQMAYNMIDMIWIGRLGSGAVAGVGTAGFFLKLLSLSQCVSNTMFGCRMYLFKMLCKY